MGYKNDKLVFTDVCILETTSTGLVSACFMDCVLTLLSLVGNTLKHAAVSQASFGLFDCSEHFLSCVPLAIFKGPSSTRSFLTNKAVQSLRINQGPIVTFMWHAKSQAKPQTYSDSHCFIIKPQPA